MGSERHAFLSYMREDAAHVDALQESLETFGIQVWRDTEHLWPGQDWRAKIREAIQSESLAFIACFSSAAVDRSKSYQYEELALAVEEYRKRPPGTSWLFTVRFDECAIPSYELVGGRTMDDLIQRADLFGPAATATTIRLVQAVAQVALPETTNAGELAATSARRATGTPRDRAETMKRLLRDPHGDIGLDDFLDDVLQPIEVVLRDSDEFPSSGPDGSAMDFYSEWSRQVESYESNVLPLLDVVRLAGMYGRPQHIVIWRRLMERISARVSRDSGHTALVSLRGYPSLLLMHVAALGCVARNNYSPLRGFAAEPIVRDRFDASLRLSLVAYVDARAVEPEARFLASALCLADDGNEINGDLIERLQNRRLSGRYTPMSDHIATVLRDLFRADFPNDSQYEEAFDRASVLLDAIAFNTPREGLLRRPGGFGQYTWRYRHSANPIESVMLAEVDRLSAGWGPIADGLFDSEVSKAREALEYVKEIAEDIRRHRW